MRVKHATMRKAFAVNISKLFVTVHRPNLALLTKLAFVQSLVAEDSFQHILRVLNTNVDGKQKIVYAMTAIRGLGRRFSNLVCKKAEVELSKR